MEGGVGVGDSLELPLGGAVEVSRESKDEESETEPLLVCEMHSVFQVKQIQIRFF